MQDESTPTFQHTLIILWRIFFRPSNYTFERVLDFTKQSNNYAIWKWGNWWMLIGVIVPLIFSIPLIQSTTSSNTGATLFLLYAVFPAITLIGANTYSLALHKLSLLFRQDSNLRSVFILITLITAGNSLISGLVYRLLYWTQRSLQLEQILSSNVLTIITYGFWLYGFVLHLLAVRHIYQTSFISSLGKSLSALLVSLVAGSLICSLPIIVLRILLEVSQELTP